MAEQQLDNQPYITDEAVIKQFIDAGIDPRGKTSTQLEDEINTLIAKESALVLFDPKDPLDYLSAGLTISGVGAGAGLGLKGIRAARKGQKAKQNIDRFQKLKNALNPVYRRGPTLGPTVTPLSGGAPYTQLVTPKVPFGLKVPQTLTYSGIGVKTMDESAESTQIKDQAALLQEDINALKVDEITEANKQIAEAQERARLAAASIETGTDTTTGDDGQDSDEDGDNDQKTSMVSDLFGTPEFDNFLRNVGSSLVETGQMGAGLARGAAKAAEERAATDLAIKLETIKSQEKDSITANKLSDLRGEYTSSAAEFQRGATTENLLFGVVDILNKSNVTGVSGVIDQIKFRFGAAVGLSGSETPVIAVANILEEVARSKPGDVLGQTGRLSDQDIRMAEDLLAAIKGLKGAFKTNEEVKEILERRLGIIGTEQSTRLNTINDLRYQIIRAGDIPPAIITDFSGSSGNVTQETQEKTRIPLNPKDAALEQAGAN